MCNSRKFRRFMALLLTIVMVFGTVGTTVSAQYGGSVTHTNPVSPGNGDYSGAFYVSLTQAGTGVDEGVRYSLVKVDKDAIASSDGITSFDQYETLGIYDVLSDTLYNDMVSGTYLPAYTKDGVIYFTNMSYNNTGADGTYWVQRQNALDYEVGFKRYGRNYLTSADMFSFRRDNLGAGNSRDIGTVDTFFELAANVVCCKIEMQKVANPKYRMLQLHFVGFCRPSLQSTVAASS